MISVRSGAWFVLRIRTTIARFPQRIFEALSTLPVDCFLS